MKRLVAVSILTFFCALTIYAKVDYRHNEWYDSSADYWKLMDNGDLVRDGDGWLKDKDGLYILKDGRRVSKAEAMKDPSKAIGEADEAAGLFEILRGVDVSGTSRTVFDSFRKAIEGQKTIPRAFIMQAFRNTVDMSVAKQALTYYASQNSVVASTLNRLDYNDITSNTSPQEAQLRVAGNALTFAANAGISVLNGIPQIGNAITNELSMVHGLISDLGIEGQSAYFDLVVRTWQNNAQIFANNVTSGQFVKGFGEFATRIETWEGMAGGFVTGGLSKVPGSLVLRPLNTPLDDGRLAVATAQTLEERVFMQYQQYANEGFRLARDKIGVENLSDNVAYITRLGQLTDEYARFSMRIWAKENNLTDILVNKRLYDPFGTGKFRVPDLRTSRQIFDLSLELKDAQKPQIIDFSMFSNNKPITIIRPEGLGGRGSYSLINIGPNVAKQPLPSWYKYYNGQ